MVCAAALAGLVAAGPAEAWADPPGVTTVAPGVQVIDGAKVPRQSVDASALEALIKDKKSLRAVKKFLKADAVTSVGPGGSTVHMYKIHDTATDKDLIAILFVKGDEIVDHLVR